MTQDFRRTALIVACALFMQNLDATVLATALPTMARDYRVAPDAIGLALTGYLLALAIFIPASGPISDRFGASRTFQSAIAIFMLGSAACGFAQGLNLLVAARFLQGIGGAMMVPVGRLVLLRSVQRHEMVPAMAWLTMPAMLGPILGPPLGGAIITWFDWRWIFWINLPMGVAGILLVQSYIHEYERHGGTGFDWRGFALCACALAPLVFGLHWAARPGAARISAFLVGFSLLAGALYVRHARTARDPLLDLALLRIPTFRLSVIGGTMIRITQGAMPFLMPMLLQLAYGLSPMASGALTLAMASGAFLMKGMARNVLQRFGFRITLSVVGMAAPVAYAITGWITTGWPLPLIFGLLGLCGFFMSLQFTAYNAIAYADVDAARMSRATSFYATFQQISLSLGVCAGTSALGLAMRWHGHGAPGFGDFSVAIWIICGVSMLAIFANRAFADDAGAQLHGR